MAIVKPFQGIRPPVHRRMKCSHLTGMWIIFRRIKDDREVCVKFKNKLENFGINGSIRRELGSDIDGACGQLRMLRSREKGGAGA